MRILIWTKWTVVSLFLLLVPAIAQEWPAKLITVVVPYPPGGYYDLIARVVGGKFQERLGKPALVENRGGGNAIIGTKFTANSVPDGYTIMVGGIGPHSVNSALYPNLSYDPLVDFAPIIHVANQPAILVVHPAFGAKSLNELLAMARAKPGEINYASNGVGTGPHMAVAMLEAAAGVHFNQVPFKGSAPSITATLGGHTPLLFGPVTDLLSYVQSGHLRALAVSSPNRLRVLPEVPTMAEAGVANYQFASWFGFFAPAGTPRSVVLRLNSEIGAIMEMPDVRDRLTLGGTVQAVGGTPEQLRALVESEIIKWKNVVNDLGIKVD